MNLCGDCGEQNDSDARFCKKCGTLLIEKNETPDEAVVKKSADCMICGADSSDGAKFCDSCGLSIKMVLCNNCTEIVDPGSNCCTSCGALLSGTTKQSDESVVISMLAKEAMEDKSEDIDEILFDEVNGDSVVAQFTKTKKIEVFAKTTVPKRESTTSLVELRPQQTRIQQGRSSYKCPECGSRDIKIQIVTESEHMGCIGWFIWILLVLSVVGIIFLVIPIFRTSSKSKTMAVS